MFVETRENSDFGHFTPRHTFLFFKIVRSHDRRHEFLFTKEKVFLHVHPANNSPKSSLPGQHLSRKQLSLCTSLPQTTLSLYISPANNSSTCIISSSPWCPPCTNLFSSMPFCLRLTQVVTTRTKDDLLLNNSQRKPAALRPRCHHRLVRLLTTGFRRPASGASNFGGEFGCFFE